MFSFLREHNTPEGNPGPLSARRIAAFLLIFLAAPLFFAAFPHSAHGWPVFIPGGLCLILATVLFLFTTLSDLKEIVAAAAQLKKS
jgi:Na+/melibiose symporter-like transporter